MLLTVGSKIKDSDNNIYVLDHVIGSGGFGSVFKGHRESDGISVAIKTLLNSFASQDGVLSFQKELQRASVVESEHVIKYFYTHDGSVFPELPPYIIMEYAEEGTLEELLNLHRETRQYFDNATVLDFLSQLADGMKSISQTLVHRDIKPQNILVSGGKLKISDFGLSKYSGDSTRTLTFKGYGTAKYVAPEAWDNDNNTIQMDIYSMGIVFYEIATLQYPYEISSSSSMQEYRNVHLFNTAKNPSSLNSQLPQSISSLILKMLEKPIQKRCKNWESIIDSIYSYKKPSDDIGLAVERALAKRNDSDMLQRKKEVEYLKNQEDRKNRSDFIYSQYNNSIYAPIRQFVELFDSQYPGKSGLQITESRNDIVPEKFSLNIGFFNSKWIKVDTIVIFPDTYSHEVPGAPYYSSGKVVRKNYIPQCAGRNVQAWSYVRDQSGRGFNLLLLEEQDAIYGDWYILRNTNSAFNNDPRNEPFGFTLQELPKEIVHLRALHIYNSELLEYTDTLLLDYLADHV